MRSVCRGSDQSVLMCPRRISRLAFTSNTSAKSERSAISRLNRTGFWPKLVVFNAAIGSGYVALAVAGILGTVIGAYYYLRIVKVMYMDEPAAAHGRVRQPVRSYAVAAR